MKKITFNNIVNMNYFIYYIYYIFSIIIILICDNNNKILYGGDKNNIKYKPINNSGSNPKIIGFIDNNKLNKKFLNKKNIIITIPHKCINHKNEHNKKKHLCDYLSKNMGKNIYKIIIDMNDRPILISTKQNRLEIDDNRYNGLSDSNFVNLKSEIKSSPLWDKCKKFIFSEKIDLHIDVHSFNEYANPIFDNVKYNKKIIILINENSKLSKLLINKIKELNDNSIFLQIFDKNYSHIIALHNFFENNNINSVLLEFNEKFSPDELQECTKYLLNFLLKNI
jgi:hypothetical protein